MTGFAYAGAAWGIGVVLTRASREGRIVWRLAQPVVYDLPLKAGGQLRFVIPAAAETDGASVPACLAWLVRVVEYTTFLPSALHDHLFDQHQAERAAAAPFTWRRVDIDHVFREALRAEGVGKVKRWGMWAAVRAQAIWTRDR